LIKYEHLSVLFFELWAHHRNFLLETLDIGLQDLCLLQIDTTCFGNRVQVTLLKISVGRSVSPVAVCSHEIPRANHQVKGLEGPCPWLDRVPVREYVNARAHANPLGCRSHECKSESHASLFVGISNN